jgi:protein-S-isoprenylcysteine O-methyltransferase Ste14
MNQWKRFITQHWLIAIIGVVAMVLNYLIALKADQELIEKFGDDYQRYVQRGCQE